jgi:N-methylhydantoinase B/oxoprolinase/acetone carboxylase alpha subunit
MKQGRNDWQTMREAYGKASTSRYSNVAIKEGDRVCLVMPGGGGYGDPEKRDPDSLAHDLCEGNVSAKAAAELYGYKEV